MNHADADKLQRLKLNIYRIAMLAMHDLQGHVENEDVREAIAKLHAIQDLTEE